jgi:hypothetical protein
LDEHQDLAVINKVHHLLATTLDQQHKADTSKRLASDPKSCVSSAHKEVLAARPDPRDHHLQIESSECRREATKN